MDFDSYWHPDAMKEATKFCTDDVAQLHHYQEVGYFQEIPTVYADLGELVTGKKPGRADAEGANDDRQPGPRDGRHGNCSPDLSASHRNGYRHLVAAVVAGNAASFPGLHFKPNPGAAQQHAGAGPAGLRTRNGLLPSEVYNHGLSAARASQAAPHEDHGTRPIQIMGCVLYRSRVPRGCCTMFRDPTGAFPAEPWDRVRYPQRGAPTRVLGPSSRGWPAPAARWEAREAVGRHRLPEDRVIWPSLTPPCSV